MKVCKKTLTEELKVSRSSLYYKHLQPDKDERLRILIESCMKEHPSYGYRRVSQCLEINHKQAQRVMQKYNLKPARRCKTPSKPDDLKKDAVSYPDITSIVSAVVPDFIWIGDFTFISFQGKFLYLATVLDRYTSEVLGYSISTRHTAELVVDAFTESIVKTGNTPAFFHSDQGSEYTSNIFTSLLKDKNISISCSPKSSPWRNGAQESFFGRFKVEFGDPDRFDTLPELIESIYLQIDYYNTKRIHSRHKTQPEKVRLKFKSVYTNVKLSTPGDFFPPHPLFYTTIT